MFCEKEEKYSCREVLAVLQKEPLCVVCLAEVGAPFCFLANSRAVYDRGSLNVYVSSLEEQMPGCPPEKGTEVILRFICRLSDRERAAVSVRGSVEKVYEREEMKFAGKSREGGRFGKFAGSPCGGVRLAPFKDGDSV